MKTIYRQPIKGKGYLTHWYWFYDEKGNKVPMRGAHAEREIMYNYAKLVTLPKSPIPEPPEVEGEKDYGDFTY